MRKTIKKYLIFLILLLALFLRAWKIGEFPVGLNADEAAIGYNAYSLLKTGQDEFGHPWPISFQSFNDYKPGLYFYLVLPFVKIFGLSELAVRLPSVILGSLTVLILYLLVIELFGSRLLALSSSLLLAVSPWHLHFSRGGWETNAATFFITLAVYLFLRALKRPIYFIFSFLIFILSLYTYHSARIITPLLIFGLGFYYRKEIFKRANSSWLIGSFIIGLILAAPLIVSFFGPAGASRFSGVGIFADTGPIWRVNELRGQHSDPFSLIPKILHNKIINYGINFFDNYFSHLSGDFLFISGDEIQRNRVPEMGQMYLIEIPLLLLGLYSLIKNKPKNWLFLLWWLAIAPLASALTFQSPHAIRSLNMVIPLIIIAAYGLVNLIVLIKDTFSLKILFILHSLFFILYLWNIAFYLHQYYVHYPKKYPAAWEYGFKDLADYVRENESKYDKIFITDKYDQPYILLAFYLKYPPEKFQTEAKLTPKDRYGFSTVANFDKYFFGPIDLEKIQRKSHVLIIGSPEEIPESGRIIARISNPGNLGDAFRIVEQ